MNNRNSTSRLSSRARVLIFSSLLMAGGGASVYFLSVGVMRRHWISSKQNAALASAQDEAREINEWVDWEFARLRVTSKFLSSLRSRGQDIRTAMSNLRSSAGNRSEETELLFVSPGGRLVRSPGEGAVPPTEINELRTISASWSTGPSIGPASTAVEAGAEGIYLAVPCYSSGGRFIGTLATYDSAFDSPFGKSIKSFEESQGNEMFLVNADGKTLERIGAGAGKFAVARVLKAIKDDENSNTLVENGNVYSLSKVASVPWFIVVRQSSGQLNADMNRVAGLILIIGLISMGFLFLLSYWTIRVLANPVRQLVEATRTVALGRFQPISLRESGEVGELINAFNRIGESLNLSYRRLATMNSLAAALVSDIRKNDIEERVVRAVIDSMNAAACILLAPDSRGNPVVEYSVGMGACRNSEEVDWKGFSWISRVIESKEPQHENRIVFRCRDDESGVELVFKKFVGVPVKLHDRGTGVLAVFNLEEGHDFDESDMSLLSAFANQAAVAIQNSSYFEQIQDDLKSIRKLKDELIQSEKMSAIGQLVSGVAHELNNPMGVVVGYAELLKDETADNKLSAYSAKILEAAQRASGIVRNLLTFSRKQPHELESADLNGVVKSVIDIMAHQLKLGRLEVRLDLESGLSNVRGNRQELQQVVLNLLTNAMQAMEGRPDPILQIRTENRGNRVLVTVSDNGPGVPEDIRSKIFEPFFTTKPVGRGTGLGLSICYGIINDLRGTISLESSPGNGAEFVIDLPADSGVDEHRSRPAAAKPRDLTGKKVLVVDDESDVREMITELIGSLGCNVISAGDASQAMAILAQDSFDVIVSDLRMPDMNGREFFSTSSELYPEYADRFIFVSGDTAGESANGHMDELGDRLLHKPFSLREIAEMIERVA